MATGKTILIVDDDSDIRSLYSTILEGEGYQVITAENGKEGLKQAQEHHPDLILLDIMMPEMDGRQMLAEVRKDAAIKNTKVLMFTALIKELGKSEIEAAGANGYIEKSDAEDPQVLITTIKSLISG